MSWRIVKNQEEILNILNLDRFHERVLYRTLELLGRNREEILSDILDSIFSVSDFEETYMNLVGRILSFTGLRTYPKSHVEYIKL